MSATLGWTCAGMVLAGLQGIVNESWHAWSGSRSELLPLQWEIVAQLLLHAVVVAMVAMAVRLTRVPMRDYLGLVRPRAGDILLAIGCGVAGWIVLSALAGSPMFVSAALPSTDGVEMVLLVLSLWTLVAVAGPLAEELLFRGFMHYGLQSRLGAVGTLVVTSLMFGLIHRAYGRGWDWVIVTFCFGLVFGWLRWRSRGIAVPLAAHMTFNLIIVTGGLCWWPDGDTLTRSSISLTMACVVS